METPSPILLEISSDEEADFGNTKEGGSGEFLDGDDHNWLTELLGEVDRNKHDDSDDLVVVGEVFSNPPKPSVNVVCNKGGGGVVDDDDDDDDDCVILDDDPDKPVLKGNGTTASAAAADDDDSSDDLEIVGEKGEVACRDFPHARHLCAKFLFASTAHEVHCGQCHCYVCDTLAPCAHWGTGFSIIDHCHASDKEEFWRAERKSMKKGCKPEPTFPISNTSFLPGLRKTTQVSALARPQSNSTLPSQFLKPVTMRPCSISSNVSVPNAVNPVRRPVPPVFKRSGLTRASPNNRHGYGKRYFGSQLSKEPTEKRSHVSQTPVLNRYHASNLRNIASPLVSCANNLPFQPQRHSRPIPGCLSSDPSIEHQRPSQPYLSSNFVIPPFRPQGASQSNVGNFKNMIISQPDLGYQSNCSVSSLTLPSNQSDAGNAHGNQLHSGFIMPSRSNMGNTFENQSSQRHADSDPSSLLINGQHDVQQGSQTQGGLATSLGSLGFDFDASFSYGNLQDPLDMYQLQSAAPAVNTQNQSLAPVSFHQQCFTPANSSSHLDDTGCNLPAHPDSFEFHFDSWMFETQSLPGAFEVPQSPPWNVITSEPASADAGTLFDI